MVATNNKTDIAGATLSEILQEDRSLYSTQFALGFKSLSFVPELESDFRLHYLENNPGQLKRALPLAVVLTLLFIVSDYLRLPHDVFVRIEFPRGVQLTTLLVMTALIFSNNKSLLETGVIATLAIYGVTTAIILGIINASGEFSPISAQLLILAFCYFLSGLRFFHAVLAGLTVSLAYPASQVMFANPLPNLAFNCYMILVFNMLGLCGAYFIEYTSRENYLQRQLLSELALFDGLTGLLNRRAFGLDLEKVCRQARRDQVDIAVAMVDVDHFKEYNDYFGHMQGDHCLSNIASALRDSVKRPLDKAGRYGGEEFILLWYDCGVGDARRLGESTRLGVESLAIPHGPGATQRTVTISIGIATCKGAKIEDSGSLIRAADRALYQAKAAGRNKVILASDISFTPKPLR
jgi:diguanylate cyclase (GGDEF)-like protein